MLSNNKTHLKIVKRKREWRDDLLVYMTGKSKWMVWLKGTAVLIGSHGMLVSLSVSIAWSRFPPSQFHSQHTCSIWQQEGCQHWPLVFIVQMTNILPYCKYNIC